MKKIQLLLLTVAITSVLPVSVFALGTNNIKEQKAVNKNSAQQLQEIAEKNENSAIDKQIDLIKDRYMNNLRTCEPLHVHEYLDIFGLKVSFDLDINGWVKDKCAYNLTGNMSGIGKDIREVFNVNVSDEEIAKIKPVIKCNFTKEQLNILVDAIIARNERNETQIAQMLKHPDKKIDESNVKLTPEEEKLVQLLVSGTACTIPNSQELMEQFSSIIMPELQEEK